MTKVKLTLENFDTRECAESNAARIESFCLCKDDYAEAVGFDVVIHTSTNFLQDTIDAMRDDGYEI